MAQLPRDPPLTSPAGQIIMRSGGASSRMTVQGGGLHPATHGTTRDENAPLHGVHFRLRADVPFDSLPNEAARAASRRRGADREFFNGLVDNRRRT